MFSEIEHSPDKLAKPTRLEGMGDIKGTIYDFEKAGDLLLKHNHTEDTVHITIVAKGSIKVYSHDWEIVVPTGKVVDFKPNQPHEFMALEDDTRIVNIVKKFGGYVDDYTAAPVVSEPEPEPVWVEQEYPQIETINI